MARLVRRRLMQFLMVLGIRVTVPRHRVGVSVVALDHTGRILLLRHVFHPFVPWGLPGGWLARNETPDSGALRELKEETGLTGRLGPVVHVAWETELSQIGIAYLAHVSPTPMMLSSEILEAEWFEPEALPTPLLPFTRSAIRAALQFRLGTNQG